MKTLISGFFVATGLLSAGTVTPLFQPSSLIAGPFPSDALTTSSSSQKTGRQIHLPSSACAANFAGSICGDINSLNSLDGFSVNPRTMVCFSGPVNSATLHAGMAYLPLDRSTGPVAVNQIFYDPKTNCVFVKPDQVLHQQTSYLLTITDSILDSGGTKITASTNFQSCLQGSSSYNCPALTTAVKQLKSQISGNLVAASLFTTMSATTWLEKARQYVDSTQLPLILPAGLAASFKISNLKSFVYYPQDNSGTNPPTQQAIPLSALSGVDSVLFGLYLSPSFIVPSGSAAGTIPTTPTNQSITGPIWPLPPLPTPVSFHVFLPPSSKLPAGGHGFPLVIYGHGLGDTQFGAPTYIASTLASQGFATMAIEITGHGFGPNSTVKLTDNYNNTYVVATPGRAITSWSSAPIGPTDGCILAGPVAVRDCARQSALDLASMVKTLVLTQGLLGTVDPSRIYYVGQSFGSTYGTLFNAVEPAVHLAVLNGAGGTSVDVARLAITGRPLGTGYLADVNPALLNVAPPTNAPPEPYFHDAFNDNYPYRDVAPLINNVPGAPAIQAAFETADWLGMLGDPLAYAPHLKLQPLSGVPAKSVLFQFGLGDLEVPNPTESALVNAAGGIGSTWLFQTQIMASVHPELLGLETPPSAPFPILPHRILSNPTVFSVPAETPISLAEQQQVAAFFSGNSNPDPNQFLTTPWAGFPLFQFITSSAMLPEMLNFLQIPR